MSANLCTIFPMNSWKAQKIGRDQQGDISFLLAKVWNGIPLQRIVCQMASLSSAGLFQISYLANVTSYILPINSFHLLLKSEVQSCMEAKQEGRHQKLHFFPSLGGQNICQERRNSSVYLPSQRSSPNYVEVTIVQMKTIASLAIICTMLLCCVRCLLPACRTVCMSIRFGTLEN